jgi:hypothetical protein
MKRLAPITAATVTGAEITTAEAMATCNPIIGFKAVELNRRFHSDLPQLPNRLPEIREAR